MRSVPPVVSSAVPVCCCWCWCFFCWCSPAARAVAVAAPLTAASAAIVASGMDFSVGNAAATVVSAVFLACAKAVVPDGCGP